MPIKLCQSGGKSGKKHGDSGKCYTGEGAEAKAQQQMRAIKANAVRKSKKKG